MNTTTSKKHVAAFRRLGGLLLAIPFLIPFAVACRDRGTEQARSVVISAPADGVIRRVVVDPDAAVDKDAALIEIAIQPEYTEAGNDANIRSAQAQVARAKTDLAAAEAEADRTATDVGRIEPLVKRGLASQAELDKARAQSQDSQERLRIAREKANTAETNRQNASSATTSERIVVVRAPSAGTVQAVNVHAGQVVVTGQPVATLISMS